MSDKPSLISRVFGSRGLKGISEIRTFFRTNEQPIFFVGPTAFNLLGIDRWVRGFEYIVYYDSWDGAHPRVFTPPASPTWSSTAARRSTTTCCAIAEVQAFIESRCAAHKARPMVAMVFFDEETEQICAELDYDLILPPDSLRRHLDSKIVTTKLGEEAGAPSVPNVLGQRRQLRRAHRAGRRGRPGLGPGGADALRRLGQDDVLHHQPRPSGTATARTSSART